jgi:Na+/H+-dicarboxylate symporter
MIKLQEEGVFVQVIKDYTLIFAMIGFALFVYINLAYMLASKGKVQEWISCLKNMMPAAISGLSTMSSAASMPLTILGVEKNTRNKMIAKSVVPATVNIHLIGDCFAIPIFAYAVMKSFGMNEPTLLMYLTFTFFFVISKFSVAGVPGGGILVMLPVLEANLGFNAGMLSLITALYILFDPVITCANVLGNGAFAKIIDSITGKQYEKTDTRSGELAKA